MILPVFQGVESAASKVAVEVDLSQAAPFYLGGACVQKEIAHVRFENGGAKFVFVPLFARLSLIVHGFMGESDSRKLQGVEMINIDVVIDGDEFHRKAESWSRDFRDRRLKNALWNAGTNVAKGLAALTEKHFKNPTPFTRNAFGRVWSKDSQGPYVDVFVKDMQARYLGLEVHGGMRHAGDYATTKRGPIIPLRDARLSKYGGLPRGYTRRMMQQGANWIVTNAGRTVLVKKNSDGSTAFLAEIIDGAHYEKKFDFFGYVATGVDELMPRAIAKAIEDQ